MTKPGIGSVGSVGVGSDFGLEDEGPFFPWLPPEDRLWRHPSEADDSQPPGPGERSGGGSGSAGNWLHAANSGPGRIWTVAIVAGVIGAMAASGVGFLSGAFTQPTTVIRSVLSTSPAVTLATAGGGVNWTSVDKEVAPSVVAISISGADGPQTGSGLLLINSIGRAYVVTDRSLIGSATDADDLGPMTVTFISGKQARGRLVGQDPLSGLAVISVPNIQATFPTLGSVAELAVANPVMAIGAQNLQGGSVFAGSVTAENRQVDVVDGDNLENMIAVSGTSANPAVAGGPLVDQYGRVVGITVDVDPADPTDQNLTFAVPMDEVERVAAQIVAGEKVTHPWLGLYDSSTGTGGALAGGVTPNSPASRIGLAPTDVITSLNGQPVTSAGTLTALLSRCQPSDRAGISFVRDGKTMTATIVVSNQPYGS